MTAFGLIIVDKPVGPTSHQVVTIVRKGSGVRKVGHAGTLDPRASGVLVLCLGAATRLSEYLSISTKCYRAIVRFGTATRTFDTEGDVTLDTGRVPTLRQVREVLPSFSGTIEQTPPPFSAIKVKGKKAYELARKGDEPQLDAREVTISKLEVVSFNSPDLTLDIECSAGTYIRSLANDLGTALGTGAHLAGLQRTKAGPFTLEDAIPLPKLEVGFLVDKWERYMRPAADALPHFPTVVVGDEQLQKIRNGHRIEAEPGSSGLAKALDTDGELIAILEAVENEDLWHPRKVFI